ncbi:hypothetical protein GJ744_002808 [Endocarpon pusillum]|uniref:Uncharacterized protein n=1 Tax=Endocarpon pusillum TaxID=364733 RepID=A0A8H7E892_9EURO|nr:hypothetical protein GJ744_002808 [Endocarpon pusillum]
MFSHEGFFFVFAFYDINASLPFLFAKIYHFNDFHIGPCYFPSGLSCMLAAFRNGQLLDRNFCRFAKSLSFLVQKGRQSDLKDFSIEKARLQNAVLMFSLSGIIMLIQDWISQINGPPYRCFDTSVLEKSDHGSCLQHQLDSRRGRLPRSSATATATNILIRCLLGAGTIALGEPDDRRYRQMMLLYVLVYLSCGDKPDV